MYNDITILLLYTLSLFSTGFIVNHLVAYKINQKLHPFILFGTAFLTGVFGYIFVLYILSFFNMLVFLTPFVLKVYSFIVFVVSFFLWRKGSYKMSIINSAVLGLFIIFFIPLIKDSLYSYLIGWDSVAIWMLKAKMFFYQQGFFNNSFFEEVLSYPYSNKSYPVGISLLIAGYYRLIGSINDQASQFILNLFYINIVLTIYGSLRTFLPDLTRIFSFLITLSLCLLPYAVSYAHNGYMEIPLSLCVLTSTVLLMFLIKSKNKEIQSQTAQLILIVGALAMLIKNEGQVLFATQIILLLLLIMCKKINIPKPLVLIRILILLVVITLPTLLWKIVVAHYFLPPDYYFSGAGIHPDILHRAKIVIFSLLDTVFNSSRYGILVGPLFLLFFIHVGVLTFARKMYSLLPFIFIFMQIVSYCVVFLIASVPIVWQSQALDRLILHIIPSFFLVVVLLVPQTFSHFVISYKERIKLPRIVKRKISQ